jgi:hypothetical protein
MSISNSNTAFGGLRNNASAPAATAAPAERKPSNFWLNAGVWIEGKANDDGSAGDPLFVSLPMGIALDDMKPTAVKGSNQDWINLAQTKNEVLEFLQKHAASMAPGDRQFLSDPVIGQFGLEIYRRNEPQQQAATDSSNPLVASLMSALGQKRAA